MASYATNGLEDQNQSSFRPWASTNLDRDRDLVEPIAIIGLSLKFPQNVNSLDTFWRLLLEQGNTATEFPSDRLSASGLYHPDPSRRGTLPLRGGHFIKDDIALFDAPFFSISHAEAAALDPQQRGLLETTYRALENAGLPLDKVAGSKTSVYTGCFTNDWQQLSLKDSEQAAAHTGLGVEASMNANRISWFYNLTGASFNVDSACSSSLVALDLACQGLLSKDANMSIVAGCNLIIYPDLMHALSNLNLLSPDNQCFSFDSRANGYARGEGFGVLVLKRLEDAIRDKDMIRAVIRSTGSNSDGYTPSITQPNGLMQKELIRHTYEKAGLSMSKTNFVEAHGTGTVVGDPIEIKAIGESFRGTRSADDPLYVGAVKANIGHLEGASGIAGVIKTVIALEKGIIPPNTNFREKNPNIDLEGLRIQLPLSAVPWPRKGLRRASINSFGFGGTNAHAVIDDAFHYLEDHCLRGVHNTTQEPPSVEDVCINEKFVRSNGASQVKFVNEAVVRAPKAIVFSAKDEKGLDRIGKDYREHFAAESQASIGSETYLERLAHTLNTRRTHLPWRSYAVVDSAGHLSNLTLSSHQSQRAIQNPNLGFVFTGQGANWVGMAQGLTEYKIFSESLRLAEEYLLELQCSWKLREEIWKGAEETNIHKPEFSQPIVTTIQVALVELLRSFNIRPSLVIGHSSGEIAAAYCFGAISAESAWKIAYYRGTLATKYADTPELHGGMLAVGLSEHQVAPYIEQVATEKHIRALWVACINSQKSVTVSGSRDHIEALQAVLQKDNVFERRLPITVPYHSSRMRVLEQEYRESINDIKQGAEISSTPMTMISSVTGYEIAHAQLYSPQYWIDNMISPVNFLAATQQIRSRSARRPQREDSDHLRSQVDALIEIGPHSALQGYVRHTLSKVPEGDKIYYGSILQRQKPAVHTLLDCIGKLHVMGFSLDLDKANRIATLYEHTPGILPNLPEYPFNHSRRYWTESRVSERIRLHPQPKLDLLGKPVPDWNHLEAKWRNFIRSSEMPWVEDHLINGTLIYPAAGMLVMAIEAANQIADQSRVINGFQLKDVLLQRALNVPQDSDGIETQLYIRQILDTSDTAVSWMEFRLCSFENGCWRENCRGSICIEYKSQLNTVDNGRDSVAQLEQFQRAECTAARKCTTPFDRTMLYSTLKKCGFGFGPAFQRLDQGSVSDSGGEATSNVTLYQWPVDEYPQPHIVHPTTLDAILHLSIAASAQGGQKQVSTQVPTQIRNIWIAKVGLSSPENSCVRATATIVDEDNRGTEFNISVLDTARNRVLAYINGLRSTIIADIGEVSPDNNQPGQACYQLELKPDIELLDRAQLYQYCARTRDSTSDPVQFYQDLSFLLLAFLSYAVKDIETAERGEVQPHLHRYMDWARKQVQKYHDGRLPHTETRWQVLLQDDSYIEYMCTNIAATNTLGRVFVTTGRSVAGILRGEIEPLQFLFKMDLLRDWYREVNHRTCFDDLARYLELLSHKDPELKVLEIGAGTGGTTGNILSYLTTSNDGKPIEPRYSNYHYTDISPSFFEQAREDFRQYPNMTYSTLDIASSPLQQNFESQAYDLIVAANVLHATPDIQITMKNVRQLLKPGGKLVVYEPTRPDIIRTGFIAGLLPGWWVGVDAGRQMAPTLTCESWAQLFCETGFSGLDLELRDFQSVECQEGSILVTTASEAGFTEPTTRSSPIIVADLLSSAQKWAAERLQRVITTGGSPDCKILGIDDAVALPDRSETVLIFVVELEQPVLYDLSSDQFTKLQQLLTDSKDVIWISAGGSANPARPEYAVINGLSRVLRNENPERRFITLALGVRQAVTDSQIDHIHRLFRYSQHSIHTNEYEPEFVEIDDILHVPRLLQASELSQELALKAFPQQSKTQPFSESPPLRLVIGAPGLLDTIHFIEDHDSYAALKADEVEIEVRAVGMNFRDCLIALGRVPGSRFGSECAGLVTRAGVRCDLLPGDRVVMSAGETFRTFARGNKQDVLRIPNEMSFVEAASIPSQFGTAWQALHELARLQRGETVLIHAGAGGTGQAAIQVAHHLGAIVYATVGSKFKKAVLVREYGIPEQHVFYSRDTSFAQGIMRITDGRGVDVVLNSLAGDGLVASWECIAAYGRFIEIGKKDILANSKLPMYSFRKNASFMCFDGFTWLQERPAQARQGFKHIFDLFARKQLHTVRPLHVYSISEVEDAFRLMQDGRSAGKIVLEISPEHEVQTVLATMPVFVTGHDKTYLIAGGLGGLGRSIARWLVDRGARNLILLSRSGAKSEASISFVNELRARGARVEAPPCDVSKLSSLQAVLERCAEDMPPIRGCIQGSMVLRDALFDKMTLSEWRVATDCKTIGSWNLHTLLPRNLDFFILLSSASGIVGLRGQANYAAGNTYLDALARYRVARGERAVSLDLGAMTDDGLLAENTELLSRVLAYGALNPISRAQCFATLDYYCSRGGDCPPLTVRESQSVIGLGSGVGPGLDGIAVSRQTLLRHVCRNVQSRSSAAVRDECKVDAKELFAASASRADGEAVVAQALVSKLAKTLSTLQTEETDIIQASLAGRGVDSLLAVELRTWIAKEFQADVAVFEILGGATFATVSGLVATRSRIERGRWVLEGQEAQGLRD